MKIEFKSVKPQGSCFICGKPQSEIRITINDDGFDDFIKAHARCLIRRMNQAERYSLMERALRQKGVMQIAK